MKKIKILQFGEGNFLRAFVDTMVDTANLAGIMDASVTIVKPIRSGQFRPAAVTKLRVFGVGARRAARADG